MDIKTIKIKWAENELSQDTHIVEFENCCVVIDAGCSVNHADARRGCGHERADLRHHGDERDLAHIGGFTRHVGARNEH